MRRLVLQDVLSKTFFKSSKIWKIPSVKLKSEYFGLQLSPDVCPPHTISFSTVFVTTSRLVLISGLMPTFFVILILLLVFFYK